MTALVRAAAAPWENRLARLVCALARPEDEFEEPFSVKAIFAALSDQDRTVVVNVARRLDELEADQGAEAAEAALVDVLSVLAEARGAAC